MVVISTLLLETIALLGSIALTFFAILVVRGPHHPRWLRIQAVQTTTTLILIGMFGFAVAFHVSGQTAVGASPLTAIVLVTALCLTAIIGGWRLVEMSERLRRADAGVSPFHWVRQPRIANATTPQLGS